MLSFYEFFAGGGMARAGLGEGWQCLLANDVDPKKAASYARNWGDGDLRVGDVGALRVDELPGRADLVWASFPCQDLSLAGAGAGAGLEEMSSMTSQNAKSAQEAKQATAVASRDFGRVIQRLGRYS